MSESLIATLEPERTSVSESPAPTSAKPHVTVLTPLGGWPTIDVAELWRFRDLIYFLAWRDVKVRYKQTALGVVWAVLQPLLMMVVFTIFFDRLAGTGSDGLPYPLFACAGLLPWTFFATAITSASNSVVGSERLITKVYFPRLAVPLAAVGAAVVDFVCALALLAGAMLFYGVAPGPGFVLAPLVFGVILLSALGIGTFLAALNVAYRDFRYVVPFLIQLWMFATPALYMKATGARSAFATWLWTLNPLNNLIATFRAVVLGGPIPWGGFLLSAGLAVFVFLAGCFYFRRVEDRFADII